jgi:mRNA-degrading endonuclease RelE of RelBE toxin-antitoxin system
LIGWTVELTPTARRQYRQLEDGPKSAAKELLEDLEVEGPELVSALELRGKPRVWRARFHNDP